MNQTIVFTMCKFLGRDSTIYPSTNCSHCFISDWIALFCKFNSPITKFPESLFSLCPNIEGEAGRLYFLTLDNASISEINVDSFKKFPRALSFSFENNPIRKVDGISMGRNFDYVEEILLGGGENLAVNVGDGSLDGMFKLRFIDLNRTEIFW